MKRIAFLLVDGHALLSTASALEPLRAANQFAQGPLYDVTLLSLATKLARSSGPGQFPARPFRDSAPDFDLIFIVAGGDPIRFAHHELFSWLQRADRHGVALGGISSGPVILARAGLLRQRRFTVHWHHYADFDAMPGTWLLERRLFVIDRDRYTCAGGSAPLDMMYAIIASDHGAGFARRISNWFIQTEIRGPDAPQQSFVAARHGTLPHGVEAALELMETHIADPLDQEQIAALAGLSSRQLQRQFRQGLGASVMAKYRRIRLEKGKNLIETTRLPVSEIAQLTGFSSQAHFSDMFRRMFDLAPSALRRRTRRDPEPKC